MAALRTGVVLPTNRHRRCTLPFAALAGAVLCGCSTPQRVELDRSPTAAAFARAGMTPTMPAPGSGTDPTYQPESVFTVATLGAGDALGRAIYVHDVMLAAALRLEQRPGRPSIATVPTDE